MIKNMKNKSRQKATIEDHHDDCGDALADEIDQVWKTPDDPVLISFEIGSSSEASEASSAELCELLTWSGHGSQSIEPIQNQTTFNTNEAFPAISTFTVFSDPAAMWPFLASHSVGTFKDVAEMFGGVGGVLRVSIRRHEWGTKL